MSRVADGNQPGKLLLVGAGPANLYVITQAKQFRQSGIELTLLDESLFWFCANMAPEVLGGQYGLKDFRLDLRQFCRHFEVEFIQDQAVSLLPEQQKLMTASNRMLAYDQIAFAIGAIPVEEAGDVPAECSFPILPIRKVLEIRNEVETLLELFPQKEVEIAIVGGGASGVAYAFQVAELLYERQHPAGGRIILLEKQLKVLADWPEAVSQRAATLLEVYEIEVRTGVEVLHIQSNRLVLAKSETLEIDLAIVANGNRVNELFYQAGLATEANQALRVGPTLQTASYRNIFGSGSCAASQGGQAWISTRTAWRMGKILTHNLLAQRRQKPLRPYLTYPGANLRMLTLGKSEAALQWGNWVFYGSWVLHWKQWLDRRWLGRLQRLAAQALSNK